MLGMNGRSARIAWTNAAVYVGVLLLICAAFLIRKTLLVFILALMFSYLLFPFVDSIHHRLQLKSRIPAIVLPYMIIAGLLAVFCYFVKDSVCKEAAQLSAEIRSPNFRDDVAAWKPFDIPIGEQIVDNQGQMFSAIQELSPELSKGMRAVSREVTDLFIVPLLSFFFLKDGRRILNALLDIARIKRQMAEAYLMDAHTLMLHYMRSLLFLCLVTLITFNIVLRLLHVPYAALLALLAFPLEFVPVAGPLLAGAVILGVSMFNHYPHVWRVALFLIGYRLLQDYVVSPHLMKKGVELHPLLVIFGVFAGGEIGGIPGIFLSVPVLALVRLVYYEWRRRGMSESRTMVMPAYERKLELLEIQKISTL